MDVKIISPLAVLPNRAYANSAGLDLYSCEDVILEPGKTTKIQTNIAVALPANTFGLILGRSHAQLARVGTRLGGAYNNI